MTEDSEKKTVFSGIPINSLVIVAAAATVLYMYAALPAVILLTLSAAVVLLIIFGERFALDLWLETRGIPGREAIIPIIAVGIAIAMGAVHPATIPRVFLEKIDIIVWILSFAVIAEGIGRSGYFAFAAYKIVYKCQGNTTRLILYLFILASILTFFTTNDIVVLVLTPIIISVCVHAGIHNARLILLAQFVAANTLSMGLLIGSPTNIILGKVLHIDFFQYLALMIVPALLSCMLSMILIDWMNQNSRPGTKGLFVKRWSYSDTYRVPAFARTAHFTDRMQRWVVLFVASVVWLSVVSALEWSLFWSAIPTAFMSFFYLYKESIEDTADPKRAAAEVVKLMQFLPYGILFFATCFFVFADELVHLDLVEKVVLPYVRSVMLGDLVHASVSMVFLSGVIVNILNDLPTSALLSELLKHMEATGGDLNQYMRVVVIQAFCVGLNIGCYVTPIGALAGILWFNIIRKEERAQRKLVEQHGGQKVKPMEMPNRTDMVKYGLIHFVVVGLVMGYLLPFFIQFVDMLVSAPQQEQERSALNGMISISGYLPYIGLGLLGYTFMAFRGVLKRGNVLLGHMREVFVVLTRVTIWSMRNRGLYFLVVGLTLLASASGLLYWSEMTHDKMYGLPAGAKPLFDSISGFMVWVMVFTGTGMQDELKPHSTLGLALVSVIPLALLGGIVLMAQLSGGDTVKRLSRRLANGDIPSYRIVIINFHERFESFVRTALYSKDSSILLLCDSAHFDQAVSFCEAMNATNHGAHRLYAAIKHPDAFHNFQEYRIEQADEIYLLSDMTTQGEYEKMRYVAKLDALLNATRVAAREGLEAGIAGQDHVGDISQQDIEDLAGMPRIFIETPSERFHELLRRSSSPLLMRSAIRMTFDSDVSAFLMADMDEDINLITHYYRLGRPAERPQLFQGGVSPLSKITLHAYELDKDGREIFRRHFSGLNFAGVPIKVTADARALRQLSTRVRAEVPLGTKGAKYLDGKELKEIDYTRLMGLIMKVGHSHMHIGIPSAALSMQNVAADKIILREAFDGKTPPKITLPKVPKDERIFIFNFTPHSRAFVTELLALFKSEKRPRIVIMTLASQNIPDDIADHPAVHVIMGSQPEDLMNQICPADGPSGNGRQFRPIIHPGDRLYVFLDFDQPTPESASIDFIDRLDTQIHLMEADAQAKHRKPAVTHPDIYIAVETSGAESRVLFENFFIDKIIDTSRPRQSYMEILSMIFHRSLADRTLLGQPHGSLSHFHQAAQIANYLCRHIVVFAEDVLLKDQMASEVRLVGKSFAQAIMEVQAYSMPPMQLVSRVRLTAVSEPGGRHMHRNFRLVEVPESEPLREGDILLNVPML